MFASISSEVEQTNSVPVFASNFIFLFALQVNALLFTIKSCINKSSVVVSPLLSGYILI